MVKWRNGGVEKHKYQQLVISSINLREKLLVRKINWAQARNKRARIVWRGKKFTWTLCHACVDSDPNVLFIKSLESKYSWDWYLIALSAFRGSKRG